MASSKFQRTALILTLLLGLGVVATLYVISGVNYVSKCSVPRKSCLEHRQMGCNIDGNYSIQLGNSVVEVTCDMQTENGGWTLIANYLHRKGAPGGPHSLPQGIFPIQNSTSLGNNEVGTPAWGHISLATHALLSYQELRFFCETSNHSRLIDFAISDEKCLNYLKTGHGSCLGPGPSQDALKAGSRPLRGSTSQLPGVATMNWGEQGENRLTNYPFYLDYKNHWSVGSLPSRFECDDYESGGHTNTLHQVWAR